MSNLHLESRDQFPRLLAGSPSPNVVEIGVLHGGYTNAYFPRLPEKAQLWLVDMWTTDGNDPWYSSNPGKVETAHEVVKRTYGTMPNVTLIQSRSFEAASQFEDGFFDWIYIDADHRYEPFLRDMIVWWPKLKSGGIFSGHDYVEGVTYPYPFGVFKAVNHVFGDAVNTADGNGTSWWVIKAEQVVDESFLP